LFDNYLGECDAIVLRSEPCGDEERDNPRPVRRVQFGQFRVPAYQSFRRYAPDLLMIAAVHGWVCTDNHVAVHDAADSDPAGGGLGIAGALGTHS
jgi:hypothetical protein